MNTQDNYGKMPALAPTAPRGAAGQGFKSFFNYFATIILQKISLESLL